MFADTNYWCMIVGREKELATLRDLMASDESQFVAVYGRLRVGKTYLIREAFRYKFTFQHTGTYGATGGYADDVQCQVTMSDLFR